MKWYINLKGNIKPEFDSWQVYCEDQNGQKLATILLPQNVTEYTFTDLSKCWLTCGCTNLNYLLK